LELLFVYNNRFLDEAWERSLRWVRAHFLFWAKSGLMSKEAIIENIRAAAERTARENGLELVHAQVVGANKSLTVRVFIDKAGGVTHDDCSKMSRALDKIFDAEDFIPASYLLEVSSPGLERELYSLADFKKFAGSLAKVKTSQPINGQRNFRGRIENVEGDEIIFDDKTSGTVRFAYSAVAKANLEIDLEEELKRSDK
jgi:ribosome maturation factor RimP